MVSSEKGPKNYVFNYKDTKAKCRHLKHLPVKGLCVYIVNIFTRGRGGGGWELTREKVREATDHKAGSKIPT
jgi:hypothetical protein